MERVGRVEPLFEIVVNALFYLDHCRHINGCASFIIILPGLKSGRFIKCLNEETCALVAGQHQQQRG